MLDMNPLSAFLRNSRKISGSAVILHQLFNPISQNRFPSLLNILTGHWTLTDNADKS